MIVVCVGAMCEGGAGVGGPGPRCAVTGRFSGVGVAAVALLPAPECEQEGAGGNFGTDRRRHGNDFPLDGTPVR